MLITVKPRSNDSVSVQTSDLVEISENMFVKGITIKGYGVKERIKLLGAKFKSCSFEDGRIALDSNSRITETPDDIVIEDCDFTRYTVETKDTVPWHENDPDADLGKVILKGNISVDNRSLKPEEWHLVRVMSMAAYLYGKFGISQVPMANLGTIFSFPNRYVSIEGNIQLKQQWTDAPGGNLSTLIEVGLQQLGAESGTSVFPLSSRLLDIKNSTIKSDFPTIISKHSVMGVYPVGEDPHFDFMKYCPTNIENSNLVDVFLMNGASIYAGLSFEGLSFTRVEDYYENGSGITFGDDIPFPGDGRYGDYTPFPASRMKNKIINTSINNESGAIYPFTCISLTTDVEDTEIQGLTCPSTWVQKNSSPSEKLEIPSISVFPHAGHAPVNPTFLDEAQDVQILAWNSYDLNYSPCEAPQ